MFIEPGAQKNGFAPAERNIPFVWTTPCAPPERWQCLLWISYKHLAALRPGPILSANFRNSTLGCAIVNQDLNAEDAKVFAKERKEMPSFAYLCENLRALCV